MAVKYRIEYCNASNDTARLDIYVRDYSGSIIPVEGSADLFLLEYKADNYIVSSIADIQIYNSEAFNIDVLKTSDETELKALFYVNGILKWNGFILPDFFSTELTDNSVISMTATDRLSVLKDVTLTYSTAKISYIKLISDCLIKTGLEMDINVVADFMQVSQPSTFNIMDCYVEHSRITSRNKSLSAYDVLKSVLILLNAKLMQYGGAWWIVNRYQAQTTGGRIFTYNEVGVLQTSGTFTPQQIPFTLVEASGRRTIEPVASQTSVFMEFGGAKRYPADYEFKNYSGGYEGWTAVNGFNYTNSNKEVLSYNASGTAIYGTRDIAFRMKNNNSNVDFYLLANIPLSYNKYIKSTAITNNIDGKIKVNVMLSATSMNKTFMPVLVVIDTKNADTSKRYYAYGRDGIVSLRATFASTEVNKSSFQIVYFRDEDVPDTSAINAVSNLNIELDPSDVNAQTLVGADISLFMFGANCDAFVNEASIGISNISDGKGILYRVDQGAGNYTKKHDTDTTIFGDYILQGINGFFYNYTSDELSIHTYLSNRINGGWTSPCDTQADPILLHSVRQRARIYSKAKNVFNVQIIEAFNPLGIYTCGGNSYIVRSAKHNFLRSETNVELEEIVYQDLSKIDFVYTYFGDEKDKSITGISGISGTSGGGTSTAVPSHDNLKGITTITDTLEDGATTIHLTKEVAVSLLSTIANFNTWFELDTTVTPNAIKVTKDFYSAGEIAAFGYGGSGGSGGGGTIYNLHQLAGESISSSPADKSRLEYNATTGKWENKAGLDLSVYATKTELNTGLSSIPWSSITGEPTNLLGYGITDAVTSADFTAHVNSNLHLTSGQRTLLANTTANFTTALETKLNGIEAEANKFTLTKAGVESVLTGAITSHTHAYEASGTASAAMTAHTNAYAHGNIANGQTAFGWGNHASAGYALNSALSAHIGSNGNAHGLATASVNGFLSSADFTKLSGIATGAEVNVQSDWNAASGDAYILNKPTALPASDVHAWAKAVTKPSYIASEIGGLGASYRWLTDAYISTWNAKEPAITKGTTSQYFRGDMSLALFPTALPASDVYSWAKASTKPSYTASEIGGLGASYRWLTDAYITTWNAKEPAITKGTTSQYFRGDMSLALFPTALPASDVYAWAKASVKPTYVWSEIGNKPTTFAPSAHTHSFSEIGITGLSTNYLTKYNGSTLVNSSIFDNGTNVSIGEQNSGVLFNVVGYTAYPVARFGQGANWNDSNYALYVDGYSYLGGFRINAGDGQRGLYVKAGRQLGFATDDNVITFTTQAVSERMRIAADGNVGIGTTDPTATLDVNGIGKFKDDILTSFKTTAWSYDTSKSLKLFLDKFDIDAAGNLVVKTNLYSTGEVTAYSSGTGVSGLKLMGDMDANGKNINNVNSISNELGLQLKVGANTFLQLNDDGAHGMYGEYEGLTSLSSVDLNASGKVTAPEFKFGSWSFKEVSGNMVIYYNGTAKATIQSSRTNSNL